MKKLISRLNLAFAVVILAAITSGATAQSAGLQKKGSIKGYAPVNGMKMYYEIHGEGQPMILLHGAYMSIEGPFRQVIAEYAKTRKVIALEFQGHGRTADIPRDITYEHLADDVNALIKYLKLDSADIFGYSMGAGVGIQLAIRHPLTVKKLVLLSGSYSFDGLQPVFIPLVPQITPAMFEGSPFKQDYDTLSPNPKNFPQLVEKLKKLDMTHFNWEKDYVKIRQPLFLIFGDADVITIEHIADMFKKLGGNVMGDLSPMPKVQLAVLPHTSHVGVANRLNWILPMVTEFYKR